jgi:hypothetical protein
MVELIVPSRRINTLIAEVTSNVRHRSLIYLFENMLMLVDVHGKNGLPVVKTSVSANLGRRTRD